MKGLIFTYLLTYGGAVVSLFRPYYGFLIFVCFSIVRPESLWYWSVPQGRYSFIIAIAFLLGWAIRGFGNRDLGLARGPAIALAGYWVWAALSTLTCELTEPAVNFLINSGKIVLPTLAGLTLINNKRDVYWLAWTIVLSTGYLAFELNLSYYDGFNRLEHFGFGGMDNNSITIGLVTGVGFSFFLAYCETKWWRAAIAYAAAAFMTHCVLFSFSRGGMLGLCFVGLASAVVIPKNWKGISLVCLGAVIALAMAGPQVRAEFGSVAATDDERDWSAASRIELWMICAQMVQENPVLGRGQTISLGLFIGTLRFNTISSVRKKLTPCGSRSPPSWASPV